MNRQALLNLLPGWLTRSGPAWQDLDNWTLDSTFCDDPRTPARPATRPGPWRDADGQAAHGIYSRPADAGLTDWAAAGGWMIWRWTGPRMAWCSNLISPWNPILAQSLTLDELGLRAPYLGDWDRWTLEAVMDGHKTGGYFSFPRRNRDRWVINAGIAGVDVSARFMGGAYGARRGTLGHHFDLDGLAAEYRRVLPAELGEQASADVTAAADLPVMTAVKHHEDYPEVVCGLALGYPPEVTAGLILSRPHRAGHPPEAAEYGAYCPHCDPSRQR